MIAIAPGLATRKLFRPEVPFEEMTAQAVNQRAQTDVISRKAFPDSFRIGDRGPERCPRSLSTRDRS